ncbi:Exostosin family protein [Raphanus sativus]|uniref:Probable arabinosyltransferase ARAD1 n=1 Tax=Raphanus sativus TaxID=3726 RepID=A0A6J0KAK0_RAPSA|nr:probable arabinosyltransferase ARAD1 [Raphanus sativus]KAJ4884160.1 Exostosin family protein [Raphanus sativus]
MYGKTICIIVFFVSLIASYSIYMGTIDPTPYFSQLQSHPSSSPCTTTTGPPLRVFMYDLPRKFNLAMMDPHISDADPITAKNLPSWHQTSGVKRQHSVEYWLMASLLYHEEKEKEAVRVFDPELADAFYVPFFSSLSFNTHGKNMTDPDTELDRLLQVELMEYLQNSKYWQRSGGRDHVIPMTHPNAFRFLRQRVNASILVLVDFGRYPKEMANLDKDVVSPYVHVVESFTDDDALDPYEARSTLVYFRGNTARKAEGKIRVRLEKLLAGNSDVHYEKSTATPQNIQVSTEGMRSSKFCLHPAGDTPSSCRLFDAIVSHCVPVIISDKIELPFEDEIDYSEFSVFFSADEALEPGFILDSLRQFPKEKWLKMWEHLKNVSHHFEFQFPPKREDAVNMLWRQVKHKIPDVKLAVHRNRRLKVPDWWL